MCSAEFGVPFHTFHDEMVTHYDPQYFLFPRSGITRDEINIAYRVVAFHVRCRVPALVVSTTRIL